MVAKRPTLRDIAQHANVSVSTVSRALNNHQYVDEATRSAIQQAVEALNYPLNHLRKPRTTRRVTLLSRNPDGLNTLNNTSGSNFEYLASRGVRLELEAHQLDFDVRRIWMDLDDEDFSRIWDDCGVIVVGGMVSPDFIQRLRDDDVRFVILGGHSLPIRTNCVMADYIHGMQEAVDHLTARGRRHIGLVNGPDSTRTSVEKLSGWQLGLLRAGLVPNMEAVIAAYFDSESGYTQTHTLLSRCPDLDAIIYTDDNSAMGGMSAIKETGRIVPDDIAVIGFHDYDICRFTDPPLTTVHFDMLLMGRMAARRLCMMLDDPDDHDHWMMLAPTELIIRGST